ncbi:ParB/RepB/Spo0J family partition protein [Catenuloplanes indicus]|uniref:ParB family chromosome partitioning protein n=1 Tax=Catenuloplanes indicus TaxID=137267 RepID=A0AAE4AYL0_9ACTN|nr:ParB/RepB/Spo0J family partition protein [Catenuloplanes indicus]MDQ0366856.1 ParB family chromosome partitioning protein [Catenuloplanes indicus]
MTIDVLPPPSAALVADEAIEGEIVTDAPPHSGPDTLFAPLAYDGAVQPRAVYLDPKLLEDNSSNVRKNLHDLDDLKASMKVVGILCPLVVVPRAPELSEPDDLERYTIVIGHRRKYAAIALDMAQVPCWVATNPGEAAWLVAQLAENGDRIGLTPTEEADAYHQLTLLDWTPEQIADVRAIPVARVRQSLQLRALPQQAQDAADAGTLNLEHLAALNEFAGEPAVMTKLLAKSGSEWGFQHAISTERQKRAYTAAKEKARAELVLAGVKITGKPKGFGYHSVDADIAHLTTTDGEPLVADQVRTLPGFAAFIEKVGSSAKTTVYCTDPEKLGYVRRVGRRPADAKTEAQEAAERTHAEFVAALGAATEVRRAFYTRAYGTAKAAKSQFPEALRQAVASRFTLRPVPDDDAVYTALGGADDDTLATAGEERLRRSLVARWIAAHERNLGHTITQTWALDRTAALWWLDRLVADGYTLSDAETQLHQQLTPTPPAVDGADEDDFDDEDYPDDDIEDEEPDELEADDELAGADAGSDLDLELTTVLAEPDLVAV